jgi:hypothetical protein
MDDKFLEFWGNFLISAAKSKRQVSDLSNFMQKSMTDFSSFFTGLDDLSATFRKLYGLDQLPEYSADYNTMAKKAMEDFQTSFKEYMGSMGIVSRQEYLELIGKYEKLKEKCADQEETIRHLKMLLNEKNQNQGDVVRSFQDMVKDQTELFQKMMGDFGKYAADNKLTTSSAHQADEKDSLKGEKKDDRDRTNGKTSS